MSLLLYCNLCNLCNYLKSELCFVAAGNVLKVYGEKDADGFFVGDAGGRRGIVPCNMVSEVQVDDPKIAAQLLLMESSRSVTSSLSIGSPSLRSQVSPLGSSPRTTSRGVPITVQTMVVRQMQLGM